MNRKLTKVLSLLCIGVVSLGMLVGCSQSETTAKNEDPKGEVSIGYVNWSDNIAFTYLAKAILEEKMGYDVVLKQGEAGMVFTSVASGDMDAFLGNWMPVTHKDYMETYGDDLDQLNPVLEGAKVGLVVPAYMNINTIADLDEIKDELEGQIIGIDPGAGIMKLTEQAIEEYDLDYTLLEGSGATMTAMLKKAEDANEPVVITGWIPHWMFSTWDLKFLEDPKKVYGEAENVYTITRKGFADEMPEVTEFLNTFQLNNDQLGTLMSDIRDNSDKDSSEVAIEWMNKNEDLVNSFLPKQ